MFPRLGRFPISHAFARSPRPRRCIASTIPSPLERYWRPMEALGLTVQRRVAQPEQPVVPPTSEPRATAV